MGELTGKQKKAIKALRRTGGNLKKAARDLGISSQALRSRADQASKKTSKKDYYDKDTM